MVIVGGEQAGLSMSYCLAQRGVDHVVLERDRVGPDLPGCVALGDTEQEALSEMKEAMRGHLEVIRERREAIPNPSNGQRNDRRRCVTSTPGSAHPSLLQRVAAELRG